MCQVCYVPSWLCAEFAMCRVVPQSLKRDPKGGNQKGSGNYVITQWQSGVKDKLILKYLNIDACGIGRVHNSWSSISNSVRDVRRTYIKVKMLTGTYVLQSNRSKFNKSEVSPICPLCKLAVRYIRYIGTRILR